MPTSLNRRKFLVATGGTAVTAAAAGVGGELLIGKRFRKNPSGTAMAAPGTSSASSAPAAPGGAAAPKLEIAKMKPLPEGAVLDVPGLAPYYTPDAKFYRVDTSLTIPQINAETWQLRIHGMVDKPMTITFNELVRRPMVEHDVTLTCVSEAVGGNYVGNAHWQGVLLADLLREVGIQSGADQIVMRDAKGMTIGVATEPVMDGRKSLLAVGMNGRLLSPEHGYPVRAVIPGLYGYVSATKWVTDMEFTTYGAFDAFWVKRGWSQRASIKTESRIDVPKARSTVTAGQVTIAGVAWAQRRGIEAVEVAVDGVWYQAKLARQDTPDTWRQWYYVWDAPPGQHRLEVRATDKAGYTQTAVVRKPEPNGATGYHSIRVDVT